MMIAPFSGLISPIRVLRNTDLPVPDGPSSTLTSPGGSVRVTSDQMLARPKDFDSPSTRTSTPVNGPPSSAVGPTAGTRTGYGPVAKLRRTDHGRGRIRDAPEPRPGVRHGQT